jgi:hypothetical protein
MMAASVLNSPQAMRMSVFVMSAFVKMRERYLSNCGHHGRDIALRSPRRVQRRRPFECQCRSVIRSARYHAGGGGAGRRPDYRAKHIYC